MGFILSSSTNTKKTGWVCKIEVQFGTLGLSLAILPVRVAFLDPGQEHDGRTGWTGQTGQHISLVFWEISALSIKFDIIYPWTSKWTISILLNKFRSMIIFLLNLKAIKPHFLDVHGVQNRRESVSKMHWNIWGWTCSIQFWIFGHVTPIFIQYYTLPQLTLGLKRVGRVKFPTRVSNSTCPTRLTCPPIAKLTLESEAKGLSGGVSHVLCYDLARPSFFLRSQIALRALTLSPFPLPASLPIFQSRRRHTLFSPLCLIWIALT